MLFKKKKRKDFYTFTKKKIPFACTLSLSNISVHLQKRFMSFFVITLLKYCVLWHDKIYCHLHLQCKRRLVVDIQHEYDAFYLGDTRLLKSFTMVFFVKVALHWIFHESGCCTLTHGKTNCSHRENKLFTATILLITSNSLVIKRC